MNITKEVKLVNTNRQAATPMASHRKISLAAGLLYLLTMVSIPTLALYGQVKGANYILGAGPDTAAIIGGISEVIVALAGIGTAGLTGAILSTVAGPRCPGAPISMTCGTSTRPCSSGTGSRSRSCRKRRSWSRS